MRAGGLGGTHRARIAVQAKAFFRFVTWFTHHAANASRSLDSHSENMKIEKNYYRTQLLELEAETKNQPVVFTGKYKHTGNPEWITFTTIRKYDPITKTKTVCDHINMERSQVSRYFDFTEHHHNRKFYICGRASTYEHYGDIRGCIVLAETDSENPIWMTAGSKKENEAMVRRILDAVQQDTVPDDNAVQQNYRQ